MKLSTLEKHIEESCLSTPDLARLALSVTHQLHRRSTTLLAVIYDQTEKDLIERFSKEDLIQRAFQVALLTDTESKTETALKALASLVTDKCLQMNALDEFFDWQRCLKSYKKEEN
tara:strand:+ start:54 stop:401 length:348 start_codon:yes stop_codon:yes gene_type:complete